VLALSILILALPAVYEYSRWCYWLDALPLGFWGLFVLGWVRTVFVLLL
jgi:hypothetical protein